MCSPTNCHWPRPWGCLWRACAPHTPHNRRTKARDTTNRDPAFCVDTANTSPRPADNTRVAVDGAHLGRHQTGHSESILPHLVQTHSSNEKGFHLVHRHCNIFPGTSPTKSVVPNCRCPDCKISKDCPISYINVIETSSTENIIFVPSIAGLARV